MLNRSGEAKGIAVLYQLFEELDPCGDCDEFVLPAENDVAPFRTMNERPVTPFPGIKSNV